MEKELENRLNKIEEDVNIIKVDAKEGFKETRERLVKLEQELMTLIMPLMDLLK
ncbi:MAG: hypothetical protein QME61_03010 [Patescibacteria group bacterium]|nr:hypothetical protein [Patescibacteria group bacterium]